MENSILVRPLTTEMRRRIWTAQFAKAFADVDAGSGEIELALSSLLDAAIGSADIEALDRVRWNALVAASAAWRQEKPPVADVVRVLLLATFRTAGTPEFEGLGEAELLVRVGERMADAASLKEDTALAEAMLAELGDIEGGRTSDA